MTTGVACIRAAALVVLAAAGPAAAGPRPEPGELARLARAILDEEAYQRELAPRTRPDEPDDPRRLRLGSRTPGTGVGVATLIAWLAAGLLLALGLAALGVWAWRRRELLGAQPAASTGAPRPARIERLQADALAARGLHTEALRALLAAAIGALAARARLEVPTAWTGREVVRRLPAAPAESLALARLTRRVEAAVFGGLPAGPAEYGQGLQDLREIAP